MKKKTLNLFIEINKTCFNFYVGQKNDLNDNLKTVYTSKILLEGIENNQITNLKQVNNILKENIYLIEQKFNYTFKEIILILENFKPSFINLAGYKKLNGSQILKENIIYILNTLKSYVDEFEKDKIILHIFNTKFFLDYKKIENLPIGLFGDHYSHELSLSLIKINDYKNLISIFENCNLKIKKILLKSFIKGAYIIDEFKNVDTFFNIEINNKNSRIFYFNNNSLKTDQNFNFGKDIIVKDVLKITSLKENTIKNILNNIEFETKDFEEDIIEEKFFVSDNYTKIKKKLIYDIVLARIEEILQLILFDNINFKYFSTTSGTVFLKFDEETPMIIKKVFEEVAKLNGKFEVVTINELSSEKLLKTADKIVQFGWKSEAIPTTSPKKSLISRLFEAIFT